MSNASRKGFQRLSHSIHSFPHTHTHTHTHTLTHIHTHSHSHSHSHTHTHTHTHSHTHTHTHTYTYTHSHTSGDVVGECGFGFFNCSAGGCIDINLVCDGSYDCLEDGDNSDEEGCRKLKLYERPGEKEKERKRGREGGREREWEWERGRGGGGRDRIREGRRERETKTEKNVEYDDGVLPRRSEHATAD